MLLFAIAAINSYFFLKQIQPFYTTFFLVNHRKEDVFLECFQFCPWLIIVIKVKRNKKLFDTDLSLFQENNDSSRVFLQKRFDEDWKKANFL